MTLDVEGWLVLDEPGGARHPLPSAGDPPVRVGRGSGNEIRVPGDDQVASRRHAQLAWAAPGTWLVSDLCSANGTIVDTERVVAETAVTAGSLLQIGQTLFVVQVRVAERT